MADKKTSGTAARRRGRTPADLRLISDIGNAAGQLLGSIGNGDD